MSKKDTTKIFGNIKFDFKTIVFDNLGKKIIIFLKKKIYIYELNSENAYIHFFHCCKCIIYDIYIYFYIICFVIICLRNDILNIYIFYISDFSKFQIFFSNVVNKH